MANPFPFTSGNVLTAADLNSIGERVAFTPSWVNFTPGNAIENWQYVQVNELLFVFGSTTLGSTSSISAGVRMTIPTGVRSGLYNTTGSVQLRETGVASYAGSWRIRQDSNVADVQCYDTSASYVEQVNISSTIPFTWADGDIIRGSFTVALQ